MKIYGIVPLPVQMIFVTKRISSRYQSSGRFTGRSDAPVGMLAGLPGRGGQYTGKSDAPVGMSAGLPGRGGLYNPAGKFVLMYKFTHHFYWMGTVHRFCFLFSLYLTRKIP